MKLYSRRTMAIPLFPEKPHIISIRSLLSLLLMWPQLHIAVSLISVPWSRGLIIKSSHSAIILMKEAWKFTQLIRHSARSYRFIFFCRETEDRSLADAAVSPYRSLKFPSLKNRIDGSDNRGEEGANNEKTLAREGNGPKNMLDTTYFLVGMMVCQNNAPETCHREKCFYSDKDSVP